MYAIHDRFTGAEKRGQTPVPDGPAGAAHNGVSPLFSQRLRNRLKTTGMGLGLVRLLQDAGRTEEAKATLCSLESGFQSAAEEAGTNLRHRAKDRKWVAAVSPMVGLMLAASAVLLFAVGVTVADDKRYELAQVELNGTFVKFDADKNEITIKVNGKNELTFKVSQDGKVSVGEVKDLNKLKTDDSVILTFMRDGDKNMVIEVRQGKPGVSGHLGLIGL